MKRKRGRPPKQKPALQAVDNVVEMRKPEPKKLPDLDPQPERLGMQAVYAHRDKLEGVLLTHIKRIWQAPDPNLLAVMRKEGIDLADFLRYEEHLMRNIAGENNKPAKVKGLA